MTPRALPEHRNNQAQSCSINSVGSLDQTARPIQLLYDGDCPLCLREVNFLKSKDAGRGIVAFVDIADPAYDPALSGGIDYETAMKRIHAVLPDGRIIENVAVFRQVYAALGMGWIYAWSDWPVLGSLINAAYGVWAKWRLKVTGRQDLAELVAARQTARQRIQTSATDSCGCHPLDPD
ncbi:MAG: DUF393 domain-containing protein [Synechococcaceae cyanobacterium SM2_3_2]|nr:DUF393 domain-containing protein [Synechococcaceae cyanobacterium SM2_3_2]